MSHTLLYAYPYFKFVCLKWVSVKVCHEGLKWLFRFWHRFGYIINYFPIIFHDKLDPKLSIISLDGHITMVLSDEWRFEVLKTIQSCVETMSCSTSSRHYENNNQHWSHGETRVLVFVSLEGCHLSIFHHTNITLNNLLTWLPCRSSWSGKLFSKYHLSINSHYD